MSTLQQASSSAKAERSRESAAQVLSAATFSVDTFVASFPVLVEAAGGTKQLRELLLSLAVRGSLTARLASDDRVDALLNDIGRKRNQASVGKSSRVGEPVAAVSPDEAPFLVPETWRWVRLGDLGVFMGGGTPSKANAAFWKGPIPWVSPKDMKRPYIEDAEDHISNAAVQGSSVKLIPTRSLLFVVRGMILAHSFPTAVTTREVTVNQDMKALVLARTDLADFVLRVAQEAKRRVLQQVERSSHGTCRLDTSVVENLLVPLPPLAEQKRIVARVDQLMALIDELEAKQARKREVGARFTKASLEALTSAEGSEEFERAWRRVVENWDTVLDRPEKVAQLRRGVQELAVRGVLGTQQAGEHTDGIEEVLQIQRAQLMVGRRSGGRGHAQEKESASPSPHAIPATWRWLRLSDVAGHIVDGTHHTPKYVERGCDFISAKNIRGGRIVFDNCRQITKQEFDELTKRCRPQRGNVLITKSGSIGEMAIVETDRAFTLFESVALIPVVPAVNSRYVAIVAYLGASGAFGLENKKGVGVPHLHLVDLRRIPFPLPPRPEQDRIVAKVERLMKSCDELEAKLRRAEDRASKLVEAV